MATAKKKKAPQKKTNLKGPSAKKAKSAGASKSLLSKTTKKTKSPLNTASKNVKKTSAKKSIAKTPPSKGKAAKAKTVGKKTTPAKKTPPAKVKNSKSVSLKITKIAKAWLHPLDNRLLIQVIEKEEITAGGIVLTDGSSQVNNLEGVVLAVGRGHQNKKGKIQPIEAKTGDKVIFSKYAGDKLSLDGVNFVVIRETEILGFAA